jgi:hypothetical protein
MKVYTRDEIEQELTEVTFDQMDFDQLMEVLLEGCIGFRHMHYKELLEWFFATVEPKEDIFTFKSPAQTVVVERHTDGISLNGVFYDWEYI